MMVGAGGQKGRRSRIGKRSSVGKLGQHIDAFHLSLCSMDTNCHHVLPDALMSTFRDLGGAQGCLHVYF